MDSAKFDMAVRHLAASSSRRRVFQALAGGAAIALATRSPALAGPAIKPVRCFKRGESCILGGTPCCGGKRAACVAGVCDRAGVIK